MNKVEKIFNFEIKQVGPESDRTLRFCGSDETPDRDNDIVRVNGWVSDNYMKNPVFLWAHNYSTPPIGKCVNLTKDTASKKLMFDIKFPTIDELSSDIENPAEHAKFVDMIYNMYKNHYLSATSVGFSATKYKRRDDDAVLSLPEWQRGTEFIEQELLELSGCPVPANPNALQTAKSKGLINDAQIKSFFTPKNKSGARLSQESIDKLNSIKDILKNCISDHQKAHKDAMSAYKGCMDQMEQGKSWDEVKDDMEDAFTDHQITHRKAMKGYKKCVKSFVDFLGDDNDSDTTGGGSDPGFNPTVNNSDGGSSQNGGTSDGVEIPKSIESMLKGIMNRLDSIEETQKSKDTEVDIDLESIDISNIDKKATDDELDIKPEDIEKLIQQSIENAVKAKIDEAKGKIQ